MSKRRGRKATGQTQHAHPERATLPNYPSCSLHDSSEELIVIDSSEGITRSRFRARIVWHRWWPRLIIERTDHRRLTRSDLARFIMDEYQAYFIQQFGSSIKQAQVGRFQAEQHRSVRDLAHQFSVEVAQQIGAVIVSSNQPVAGKDLVIAQNLIQGCVERTLGLFKTAVQQGICEAVSAVIQSQRERIIRSARRSNRYQTPWEILPEGSRFAVQMGMGIVIVVEQPPQIRTLDFPIPSRAKFHLAFPYTVFVAVLADGKFQQLYVFYSDQPLSSLDDLLYQANIPGVDTSGRLHSCHHIPPDSTSLTAQVEAAITYFWSAKFNTSLHDPNYTPVFNGSIESLESWQARSKEDSRFVLKIPWKVFGKSLGTLIDILLRDMGSSQDEVVTQLISDLETAVREAVATYCQMVVVEGKFDALVIQELSSHIRPLTIQQEQRLREAISQFGRTVNVGVVDRLQEAADQAIQNSLTVDVAKICKRFPRNHPQRVVEKALSIVRN